MLNLFEIKPKVFSKDTYGINIWSKNLVNFLLNDVGLVRSPKNNLHFPEIFIKDKQLALNFIKGVADTDFFFKLRDGYYPIIRGSSKCKHFMEEICMVLEEHGFKISKLFDYKILDSRFKKGYNIINTFDINGHKQFALWIKLIGTKQPKNIKKIQLWIENNKQNHKIRNFVEEISIHLEK